ncbi:4-hydroxyphenylpyruvate dioxygenase [Pantanalinema sp. GBBB05]|uniref:4-hydroxyphenylpyruvate dioxygenase n=1 Tax=Pantanalinema sp. GBBB05 TaxID=2604139 RepID=UPI001DF9A039|nr:4-hydroxyphenylpyruvate dioxygenase [Pantanalinema sp. GBBB05]
MRDIYPIKGLDHLEFYVGNAKQAAMVYAKCFGFTTTAYQGLETGERKTTSYVMEQGEIRFVISSALGLESAIARSVFKHGDTIAVIALAVSDVFTAYQSAIERGAIGAIPPTTQEDSYGVFRFAAIRAFGDTLIKFVDRNDYHGIFAPGFVHRSASNQSMGLKSIDHIVGNVEFGAMDHWVEFFVKTLGFDVRMHFDDHAISTEYSALMSKVLEDGNKTIININEPAPGRRKSQIQEYLDYHYGPGIQHLGLATDDIVQTVMQLRQAGVEFLPIPKTYYDDLGDWVKEIDLPVNQLAELGILVDRDHEGYLLQLFTKPIGDRPTLFFEIIERHGSRGFGAGNFKSLFVALEREQALRGNL